MDCLFVVPWNQSSVPFHLPSQDSGNEGGMVWACSFGESAAQKNSMQQGIKYFKFARINLLDTDHNCKTEIPAV